MSSNCLTVSTTTASVRPSAWITWVAPGPIRRDLTALPASAIAGSSSNCQARLPYGFASSFAPFPAARNAHQPLLFVLILSHGPLVLLSRSATARCAAALDPPAGLLRFKVPAPGPHRAPRPLPPVLTILPQQAAGPQLVPLRHRGRFRPLLLHLPARIKTERRLTPKKKERLSRNADFAEHSNKQNQKRSRRGRSNFPSAYRTTTQGAIMFGGFGATTPGTSFGAAPTAFPSFGGGSTASTSGVGLFGNAASTPAFGAAASAPSLALGALGTTQFGASTPSTGGEPGASRSK